MDLPVKPSKDATLYYFKNLPTFAEKPDTHSDRYFENLLQAAEYLKMDKSMRTEYDVRLKTLRDNYSAEQYTIYKAKSEVVLNMLSEGLSVDLISRVTGLTTEQIRDIHKQS